MLWIRCALVALSAGTLAIAQADSLKHRVGSLSVRHRALLGDIEELAKARPDDDALRLRAALWLTEIGRADLATNWLPETKQGETHANERLAIGDEGDGCAGCERGMVGPDIIIGDIHDVARHGRVSAIEVSAYTIGTTACNVGDEWVLWESQTNLHPVIAQNMYRLHDGRFEHIGMAWIKHGFGALPESFCDPCNNPMRGDRLGVGCSDPYGALTNAFFSQLAPRGDINPAIGGFDNMWPPPGGSTTLRGKIQIHEADLNPDNFPGARYFAEGQYIAADDIAADNQLNNCTYREVSILPRFPGSALYDIDLIVGVESVPTEPGINAWQANVPAVVISTADIPSDGRMMLGHLVTDNGDGTWTYEYAMYNMTSHLGGRSFSIPVPAGANITDIGFHDVDYHSGETTDGTDWVASVQNGEIRWETDDEATDADANALRYATLYNFRFTADLPPAAVDAVVEFFRMGAMPSFTIAASGPAEASCPEDITGDGVINAVDLSRVLGAWGTNDPDADITGDGTVNAVDLSRVLGAWGACP